MDLVRTQAGYSVQLGDGMVHVFPSIPDRESFLKLRFDTIRVHDQCIEVASIKLHTLVTPVRGNYQLSIAGPCDSRGDIELKSSNVEAVLDALAMTSNRKIWVVTLVDDTKLTSRGLRRAGSLWSATPTPDGEQPSWDLLRWGIACLLWSLKRHRPKVVRHALRARPG